MSRADYLPSSYASAHLAVYETTELRTHYLEQFDRVAVTLTGTGGEVLLSLALGDVQRLRAELRSAEGMFARQASPEITESGPDVPEGAK